MTTRSAASSATSSGRSGRSARGSCTRTTSSGVRAVGAAQPVRDLDRPEAARVELRGRAEGAPRAVRRRSARRCRRLAAALGDPAFNFIVHSNPLRIRPRLRTTGTSRSCPRRQVAGFEWGSGFHINPVRRRRRPTSSAGSTGRPPDLGAARRGVHRARDGDPVRGVRGGALVEDGRPRGRRRERSRARSPPAARGVGGDATLRIDRSRGARASSRCPRARRARRGDDAVDERGAPVYFVEHERYFESRRGLYADGHDYADNADRFAYLSRAALALPAALGTRPRVVHLNDWQTGLIPFLLRHEHARDPSLAGARTVFTIHNLAYQIFSKHVVPALGLPWDVPLRGDGVPRSAELPQGARLRRRAHHGVADLRARDHDAGGRRRARGAAPPARARDPRDPERHRGREDPATTDRHPPARYSPPISPGRPRARRRCSASSACPFGDVPLVAMIGHHGSEGARSRRRGARRPARARPAARAARQRPARLGGRVPPRGARERRTGWPRASGSTRGSRTG